MTEKRALTRGLLTSSALSGAAAVSMLLFASTALAQPETPDSETEEVTAEEEPAVAVIGDEASVEVDDVEAEDRVVVTGSRLRRDSFSTSSPITVITTESSTLAGLLDVGDILQGESVASGTQIDTSFSGFVINGGIGAESISLRGLGPERTLVLVDGKRWVTGGIGGALSSTDLSSIPTSLLSRIEILKDGASTVYGSDAISGVVNNILRDTFDGVQLTASTQLPEQLNGGETFNIEASFGKVTDNASLTFAAAYSETEELVRSDREWAECDNRPRFNGSNTDPETGDPYCFGFIYGFSVSPFGFVRYEPSLTDPTDTSNPYFDADNPDDDLVPLDFGIPFYTTRPQTVPASDAPPNEGPFYRDLRDYNQAQLENDINIFALTSYGDFNFSLFGRGQTAYYQAFYNRRETIADSGYRQYFPSVPADSVYNPFGTSGPLGAFGGFSAQPVVPTYFLDGEIEIKRDVFQSFVGLRGEVSRTWRYDAYVGFGQNKSTSDSVNILDAQTNAAIDAVIDPETGDIVCRDSLSANPQFPDCVPLNLFSEDALLRGELPDDAVDFITEPLQDKTTSELFQASVFFDGDVVTLPAGVMVAGIGAEFRRERLNSVPDINVQNDNLWNFTSQGITRGSDNVVEVFGEVEVPLLSELPFAHNLDLSASYRYTDYESDYADDIYRVGLVYDVTPELRFRGGYSESFRAPTVSEQFRGDISGFVNGFADPCINLVDEFPGDTDGTVDTNNIVVQNCLSEGVPIDLGAEGAPGIRVIEGGNPDLNAETSESITYGVVYQPDWIGLSVAVDWFDIEVEGSIIAPSAGFLLGACYSSPDLSSPFCSRISPRGGDSFLTDIDVSLINVASDAVSGFDTNVRYEHSFPIGDFLIEGEFTYLHNRSTEILGEVTEFVGDFAFPRWSGDVTAQFDYEDWRFLWRVDYIGDTEAAEQQPDRPSETEKHFEHTAGVRYLSDSWEIQGTIQNVFDEEPPLVADGSGTLTGTRGSNTVLGAGYDRFGRTYVLRVSRTF